ncbi:MAG: helix-turn-helix domain-containing protein [Bacteroidota bacterium]
MKWLFKQIALKYISEDKVGMPLAPASEKYRKSGLTPDQALAIKLRITTALEHDKLYRNNELGLGDLASYIEQDRYKVSEVINTYYAKNFYALLNSYRIEEAKLLLVTHPLLSVKAIMYEVGFNSKNSFYLAFKKATGRSPNDFRHIASYEYQPGIA